jgi:hypothetical protein
MIGNISILLFSSLFMFSLMFYLARKSLEIDVLDVYIIFVFFHFGIYPFVRGLYFHKDLIFDFAQSDPLVIGLVFAHVLLILIILKILSIIFQKHMSYLKIEYLVERFSGVNKHLIICLCIVVISFVIFSYIKYGVKTHITTEDFAKIGNQLPYWFTSVRTIYSCVTFCIYIVLLSYILKAKNYRNQILWLALTILFVPFVGFFGRRYYFDISIITFVIYVNYKKEPIVSWRNLKYGFVLLVALFLFSNLSQSYRGIMDHVGEIAPEEEKEMKNPLVAALNFQSTLGGLSVRPGTWEFSYLVFSKQIEDRITTSNGELIMEGFKSAVPRYLWQQKKFDLIDDSLAKLYGVKPKEIDIGKNIFGVMQVEFGYLSLVMVPLIILALLIMMNYLNKMANSDPIFLWLFSSNILFYLINIEENGTDIFYMLRNIICILALFAIYIGSQRIYSIIAKKY